MTDPVYGLLFAAMGTALLTAMLVPAPATARTADDDAAVGTALLGAGCAAAIAMGILALLGHPSESTICAAAAWLLVMPCVWLARAPRAQGWWDEADDGQEDDDDGGSPAPRSPSAPPAPDDRVPAFAAPAFAAPAVAAPATASSVPVATVAPPPVSVTVTGTALRVQRLIAAQDAERVRAAQEVQRLLAAAALIQVAEDAPVQGDEDVPSEGDHGAAPSPARPAAGRRTGVAARRRADHRSVAHVLASTAHAHPQRSRRGVIADPPPGRRD